MSDTTHKKIEVVGTSGESFAKAAASAIAKASESVRNLQWFEVTELRGKITGDKIAEYQVSMKIGFKLD